MTPEEADQLIEENVNDETVRVALMRTLQSLSGGMGANLGETVDNKTPSAAAMPLDAAAQDERPN